ncbi:MAG: hypothetical protein JJ916_04165 [Phycisphaerales bacterium]|nr:hypothetical protein [Phycisphaerales bacterium]
MAGPNEVAKAHVTIEGDISGLKESVQDAKKTVNEVGDAADNAGGRVDGAFTKAGEKIEESTKGVRKFVGALSSVAGVATGVIGVIGLVSGALVGMKAVLDKLTGGDEGDRKAALPRAADLLEDLADKARGADQAMSQSPGFVALANEIEDLEGSLEKLKRSLDGLNSAGSAGIGAGSGSLRERQLTLQKIRDVESDLAAKRQQQADLLREIARGEGERAAAAEREAESLQKTSATLEAIKQIGEGLAIDLLPENQQVRANASRQIEQIRKLAEDAGIDLEDFYVRAAIAAIKEKRDRELDLLDEMHQKELQNIEKQKQARIAAAIAEADAYTERVRQGLESITSGDFVTTLEAIPRALKEVSNGVRRLK